MTTKSFEIMFNDLTELAKDALCEKFNTTSEDENWDIIPIASLEREEDEEIESVSWILYWYPPEGTYENELNDIVDEIESMLTNHFDGSFELQEEEIEYINEKN